MSIRLFLDCGCSGMRTRYTSRRHVLAGFAAAAAVCALPNTSAQSAGRPSLRSLAAEKGILFGSSVGAGAPGTLAGSFHDAAYLKVLQDECAVLTPENELKAYVIAAEPETLAFERADLIAGFAKANAMKLRGHTLLWNRAEFTPKWLGQAFGAMSREGAVHYLRNYIERVCTRYRDRINSWDVVNETIDPRTGGLRDTAFTRTLGFDALRVAFEAAREHAPRAQLVYNDYMSWEKGNEAHRSGVLRLLERFKRENLPVDALGVQSHIGNDGDPRAVEERQWRAFVDDAIGMGYALLVTEFDVNDKALSSDVSLRDAEAGARAKAYLDLMLSYRQLDQVVCWGMVDKYSWLQDFSPRSDHRPQRPTPYDASFRPKPLREALAAAFASAPKRG